MCVSLAVAAGCYDSMPPSMLISKRSRKPKAQALNPLTTVWAASALVLRSSTPAFVGIQEGIHLGPQRSSGLCRSLFIRYAV